MKACRGTYSTSILAAIVAGITVARLLLPDFRTSDAMALNPFAYYCLVAGAGALACLLLL